MTQKREQIFIFEHGPKRIRVEPRGHDKIMSLIQDFNMINNAPANVTKSAGGQLCGTNSQ